MAIEVFDGDGVRHFGSGGNIIIVSYAHAGLATYFKYHEANLCHWSEDPLEAMGFRNEDDAIAHIREVWGKNADVILETVSFVPRVP